MRIWAAAVFWLLLVAPPCCSALNSDGATLLAFKRAIFSDPKRSMEDWEESDATPCRWSGVRCQTIRGEWEPRVTALELTRSRLIGSISADLGSLPYLQRLNLDSNQLIGILPPQLFNASSIQELVLSNNDISGPIPAAISRISTSLVALDMSGNGFTGTISPLLACYRLEALDLSGNRFTGSIPVGFGSSFKSLQRLDISSNYLTGFIPGDMGELSSLSGTLNLSTNNFTGPIPSSLGRLPFSLSIDLSFNNLSGVIPLNGTLSNQGPTAFLGNPGLCGMPLKLKCAPEQLPQTQMPFFGNSPQTRPPGTNSSSSNRPLFGTKHGGSGKHEMSTLEIVVIAIGDAVGVLLLMGAILMCYFFCRRKDKNSSSSSSRWCWCWCCCLGSNTDGFEASDRYDLDSNGFADELGNGELLHFDAEAAKLFDLDLLLRASAYVLGKGSTGIVYKAVLEGASPGASPTVMVVRRLGDGGGAARRIKEFEAEVKSIGAIRHPNVVPLRAYYWGMNEKLLVYDYMPNGSLAAALQQHQRYLLQHHQQGQATAAESREDDEADEEQPACLTWPQRLAIARGIARGLAHLHEGTNRKNLVHANVKPTNVLLDSNLEACVSDFGITRLSEILAAHEMMQSTSSSMRSMSTAAAAAAATAADAKSSKSSSNINSAAAEITAAAEMVRNSPFTLQMQQQQQQQQQQGSSSSLSLYTASTSIYRPPEATLGSKPTQKWDVYSFGVILLEMLTGSASAQLASSDVDMLASVRRMLTTTTASCESEAMDMVELAMLCISPAPEQRPKMKQVFEALCKIPPM